MQRFDSLNETGPFRTELFDIKTLEDEIRVDRLCESLLRIFRQHQIEESGNSPEKAGQQARGADHLLREFIVGAKRDNLLQVIPERIRQYAGNWYITHAMEPNLKELQLILDGTAEFYTFLEKFSIYSKKQLNELKTYCRDLDYYQQRIDDFWAIKGDGFFEWSNNCPMEP